jgi:hypothetical protein
MVIYLNISAYSHSYVHTCILSNHHHHLKMPSNFDLTTAAVVIVLVATFWYSFSEYRAVTALDRNEPKQGVSPSNSESTLVGSEEPKSKLEESVAGSLRALPTDPLEQQRYVDRLPEIGVTGLIFEGDDRGGHSFNDGSASLLDPQGGVKIEVTEAVHALEYLKDAVDIDSWEALGMSCTCQVIRRPYTYIPKIPDGRMNFDWKDELWLKTEAWDKEVVIIASTHGFTPRVQECFYEVVASAPWLTFIYTAGRALLANQEDENGFDNTVVTKLGTSREHPRDVEYKAVYQEDFERHKRVSIDVSISRSAGDLHPRFKTEVSAVGDLDNLAAGEQKVFVKKIVCHYEITGRDRMNVRWELDPWLDRTALPPTTVTRNVSAGINAGLDGGAGLEASGSRETERVQQPGRIIQVHEDLSYDKRLECTAGPRTPPGWSRFTHIDQIAYRTRAFAATYTATVDVLYEVKESTVIISRSMTRLSLTFELSDIAPVEGWHHVAVVNKGPKRRPEIDRSDRMTYDLKIDARRDGSPGQLAQVRRLAHFADQPLADQPVPMGFAQPVPTGFAVH